MNQTNFTRCCFTLLFLISFCNKSFCQAHFTDVTTQAGIDHVFKVYEGFFGGGACTYSLVLWKETTTNYLSLQVLACFLMYCTAVQVPWSSNFPLLEINVLFPHRQSRRERVIHVGSEHLRSWTLTEQLSDGSIRVRGPTCILWMMIGGQNSECWKDRDYSYLLLSLAGRTTRNNDQLRHEEEGCGCPAFYADDCVLKPGSNYALHAHPMDDR